VKNWTLIKCNIVGIRRRRDWSVDGFDKPMPWKLDGSGVHQFVLYTAVCWVVQTKFICHRDRQINASNEVNINLFRIHACLSSIVGWRKHSALAACRQFWTRRCRIYNAFSDRFYATSRMDLTELLRLRSIND